MTLPDLPSPSLNVVPWEDPVIDALGFDPRSPYVETFWLGILGPSTTWLLRRMVAGLDQQPEGYELSIDQTALALGLGSRGGRNAPVVRSLARCCQFGAATFCGTNSLAVRRRLPPLTRTQISRLPTDLRAAHDHWMELDPSGTTAEQHRRRARRLALSLAELGEDLEHTERQLHRWRFHPAMAREAAVWAHERQAEAEAAFRANQAAGLGDDAA